MKFFLIVALDVEERFFPFHKTIFSFFMFDSSIDCFFFIYQDMDDAIVKKLFMGQQWKDPSTNKNTERCDLNGADSRDSIRLTRLQVQPSSLLATLPLSSDPNLDPEHRRQRATYLTNSFSRSPNPGGASSGLRGGYQRMETARQFVSDLHSVPNNGCRSLPKEEKGRERERDKTEVAAIIMIFPFVSTVCPPREGCLKKRRRRRKTVERNNERASLLST